MYIYIYMHVCICTYMCMNNIYLLMYMLMHTCTSLISIIHSKQSTIDEFGPGKYILDRYLDLRGSCGAFEFAFEKVRGMRR